MTQHEPKRAPKPVSHFDRTKAFGRAMPRSMSTNARITAVFLFTHAHDDGTGIYCSVETLSEMTGLPARTQFRAIKELIDAEYLIDDGWRVYGNGTKTRRRRLDLTRMAVDREAEDAALEEKKHTATVGSVTDSQPPTLPKPAPHTAKTGGGTLPLLADKPPQNHPVEPPQQRAREPVAFFACDKPPKAAPPPQEWSPSPAPPEPRGDWRSWMPRLCDPEHRWSVLAPDSEIDPKSMKGEKRLMRAGWHLSFIAGTVAEAAGWRDYTRLIDWRPLCRWLDDDIDPRVIRETIRSIVQRRAGEPVASLGYFEAAVRDAASGGRRYA